MVTILVTILVTNPNIHTWRQHNSTQCYCRDRLATLLPLLSHELTVWLETMETSKRCQDLLQDRHQQLRLVKEAQAIGPSHSLYTVKRRFATFKRARDVHEAARAGLKEKMEECEKQMAMHNVSTKKKPSDKY